MVATSPPSKQVRYLHWDKCESRDWSRDWLHATPTHSFSRTLVPTGLADCCGAGSTSSPLSRLVAIHHSCTVLGFALLGFLVMWLMMFGRTTAFLLSIMLVAQLPPIGLMAACAQDIPKQTRTGPHAAHIGGLSPLQQSTFTTILHRASTTGH